MSEGLIAVSIIKKPRKHRRCEECNTLITGETARLFGCAHHGERPYPVYMHLRCAQDSMCSDLVTNPVLHPPKQKA